MKNSMTIVLLVIIVLVFVVVFNIGVDYGVRVYKIQILKTHLENAVIGRTEKGDLILRIPGPNMEFKFVSDDLNYNWNVYISEAKYNMIKAGKERKEREYEEMSNKVKSSEKELTEGIEKLDKTTKEVNDFQRGVKEALDNSDSNKPSD